MAHRGLAAVVVALLFGCSASPAPEAAPAHRAPDTPRASAAELARSVVDGRTGALFEVTRFRFHPTSASAIGDLCHWATAIKRLGLDPLLDIERVFVAANHALDASGIALIVPGVSDQVVADAIGRLDGAALPGAPYPRATISMPGEETHIIALIQPRLIVLVPESYMDRLEGLRVRAELPAPSEDAAARFFAFDPSLSLGSNPMWPETIVAAHAELAFTSSGGARVRFFADSTSELQAELDAQALSAESRRLLTLDLKIFAVEILEPPRFASRGRRIYMQSGLLPSDVDWLLRIGGEL
jgi:hypothetical protein